MTGENGGPKSNGETLQEVLERANEPDLEQAVTRRRFKRWRDEGLIPSPEKVGLGRGEGTATYYPEGTGELAAAIAQELEKIRSLPQVGLRLWFRGYPLTGYVRELGLDEAKKDARKTRAVHRIGQSRVPKDPVREFATQDRLPTFGRLRKRIGSERFAVVAQLLMEMVAEEKSEEGLRALFELFDEEKREPAEHAFRVLVEELFNLDIDWEDEEEGDAEIWARVVAESSQTMGPNHLLHQGRAYDEEDWERIRDHAKRFLSNHISAPETREELGLALFDHLIGHPEGPEKALRVIEAVLKANNCETEEEREEVLRSALLMNL